MVHVTIAAEHPHARQVRMFADCLPTHVSAAALKLSANGFFREIVSMRKVLARAMELTSLCHRTLGGSSFLRLIKKLCARAKLTNFERRLSSLQF